MKHQSLAVYIPQPLPLDEISQASRENHSFRWIAGALVSLQAHSEQTGRVIDAAFAAEVLRDRLQGAGGNEPSVQPA